MVSGKAASVMKSLHSRSRRDRARLPIAPTEHSWEHVLAGFADAVVVTDERGQVALFNEAAETLTGVPAARVVGEPCAQLFARTPVLAEMVQRVLESGQGETRGEEELRRRDRTVPVRVVCLPVWDVHDRIRGVTIVIHDLSYQRTLEEAARRNENLARLGTLVAGLAHEIKNPLAGIKGAAQLLASQLPAEPSLHEFIGVITKEVDRLSALVEDLLNLGAPPPPRLAPLNVHRVVQHVLSLLATELTQRAIQLRCEFDPSLPEVRGDEAQLSQVFLNVLKNAIEAMAPSAGAEPRPSLLTVSTRMETDFHILQARDRSQKFLRVEFADEGRGVDPADGTKVFEPFFTTKARGTGLGLTISQRIVAAHGGTIRITPNRPAGAVVTVTLPVAAP